MLQLLATLAWINRVGKQMLHHLKPIIIHELAFTTWPPIVHDWLESVQIHRSKPNHTRKQWPACTHVASATKANSQLAGGCVKIAGFGSPSTNFGAIFTLKQGAWLPMCLVMGPGRRVLARSRCYKYLMFKLMRRFLCGASVQRTFVYLCACRMRWVLYWPVYDTVQGWN